MSLTLKASAVFGQSMQSLLYLTNLYGLKNPLLKGLQEDYYGILAITYEHKVLVYYSNKALSKIDLGQLVCGLQCMTNFKDNLQ